VQLEETKLAEEELKKSTGAVYKASGTLLIETSKEGAAEDLKEKRESMELRLSMISKQEPQLKARLEELRKKLEEAAKAGG